jgi:hypothetical protein
MSAAGFRVRREHACIAIATRHAWPRTSCAAPSMRRLARNDRLSNRTLK